MAPVQTLKQKTPLSGKHLKRSPTQAQNTSSQNHCECLQGSLLEGPGLLGPVQASQGRGKQESSEAAAWHSQVSHKCYTCTHMLPSPARCCQSIAGVISPCCLSCQGVCAVLCVKRQSLLLPTCQYVPERGCSLSSSPCCHALQSSRCCWWPFTDYIHMSSHVYMHICTCVQMTGSPNPGP